jgi:Na+/proline symporter
LAATTAVGIRLGRSQKDARDYFVAGQTIPWWAVLFSVVATETSALTFISVPGLAYLGNFTFLQLAIGYIVGRIVVAYTLLPRYYEGRLVTAYALLEQRFGLGTGALPRSSSWPPAPLPTRSGSSPRPSRSPSS